MLALSAALRLAPPEVAEALAERFRARWVHAFADEFGLAYPVADALIGAEPLAAAVTSEGRWTAELLARTAAIADPVAAARLIRSYAWFFPGLTEQVFASVTDPEDSRWHTRPGLAHEVRRIARRDPLTVARGPFAEVALVVAEENCARVPYPTAVELCVAVAERGDADALRRLAGARLGHLGLPELLYAAAESAAPAEQLAACRPPGPQTDPTVIGALMRLRLNSVNWSSKPPSLDPDLLRREHARTPFGGAALAYLSGSPHCPPELVEEALRSEFDRTVVRGHDLPFELVHEPKVNRRDHLLARFLDRGIAGGRFAVDRVLVEARPARAMLIALPVEQPSVSRALAALCAPLGADPAAWVAVYRLLADFSGTARELIAAASAAAWTAPNRWPSPEPAVFPIEYRRDARIAFLNLLRCVPEAVSIALAPHLDQRAAQQLLLFASPSASVRGALLAAHAAPGEPAEHLRVVRDAAEPVAALGELVRRCVVLPWEALAEAAPRPDWPEATLWPLVKHPGCPRDFVLAACARLDRWHDGECVGRGVLAADDVIRHAPHPARALSRLVRDPRVPGARVAEPCDAARALTERLLGDDVEAWTVALHLFDTFTGTLPELLEVARASAHHSPTS